MRYIGEGVRTMSDHGESSYRRFLRSDRTALEELVITYSDELVRFAFGYVKSEALAEAVVSDVFAALYMKAKHFSDEDQLRPYLYKMTRNRAIDRLRRQRREVPLEDAEAALSAPSAEALLIHKERDEILYRSLSRLPLQYREVLELMWFDGFTHVQTASILNKSAKQLYNLHARAKLALKELLEKEGITREDLR